ncbi:DUF4013 domain-containing protein [Methanobrevibacter sp.]|uniref:DUF4013 domain-containing protein n=1 Tax=Methanobrevibacter sp. TaxID=66852 RepID=UPI0025D0AB60|nr:DUF4013 domain-containing protein [Methanobrevibacter sp.]MBQ2962165.1 DUF4013 domain-containing protein [Methanobrevibacter sp.]
MEIVEIIKDAVHYPIDHPKDLLIFIVLDIIVTAMGYLVGMGGIIHTMQSDITNSIITMTSSGAIPAFNYLLIQAGTAGIIAVIIVFIINLFLNGYGLDIAKLGIERKDEGPKIDIVRQILNGIKLIIVNFVYMFVPILIMLILMQIHEVIGGIIGLAALIVFGFALLMAQCRLAKNESLMDALNIPEAMKDISKVGIVKILAILVVIFLITFILTFISSIIVKICVPLGINLFVGPILSALIGAFSFFLSYRAIGLMYSDVE